MSVAVSPAPPTKPAGTSTTNPRHQVIASTAASGSSNGAKGVDYMVLSAAHEPRGDALVAAMAASNDPNHQQRPAALHDVELYSNIAKELPENSPVLSSILYSHRSVANPDPSVDDLLESVNQSVAKWKSDRLTNISAEVEVQLTELRHEQNENQKDLMRRDVEHNRALKRMEDLLSQMEKRIESDLASDTVIGHLSDAWTELGQRHTQQVDQTNEAMKRLDSASLEHQRGQQELERMTKRSKTIISESVERSVVRSDEEEARLSICFQYRHEYLLRLTEGDFLDERSGILANEEKERSLIHEMCLEDRRHVDRVLNVKRSYVSLIHHTEGSEKGLRFNVEIEEERSRRLLLEEVAKRKFVLDVVDHAVSMGGSQSGNNRSSSRY